MIVVQRTGIVCYRFINHTIWYDSSCLTGLHRSEEPKYIEAGIASHDLACVRHLRRRVLTARRLLFDHAGVEALDERRHFHAQVFNGLTVCMFAKHEPVIPTLGINIGSRFVLPMFSLAFLPRGVFKNNCMVMASRATSLKRRARKLSTDSVHKPVDKPGSRALST